MSHHGKALLPVALLALSLLSAQASAQTLGPVGDLKDGIDQFRNGQYDRAILLFHNVITDPKAGPRKPPRISSSQSHTWRWGSWTMQSTTSSTYITTYPGSPDFEEASYQKGACFSCRTSSTTPSGAAGLHPRLSELHVRFGRVVLGRESLYGLGQLDDALAVYQKIVTDFPTSVKLEAAQYKISLIQLSKREVELSRLLKWSHEDFLKSVEEYQNREKAYVQAIEAYQKRLAGFTRTRTGGSSPTCSSSWQRRRTRRHSLPPS